MTDHDKTLINSAEQAPSSFCDDPKCAGHEHEHQLNQCECGNDVCNACRKVCEACGEIGCMGCMQENDNSEIVCISCEQEK